MRFDVKSGSLHFCVKDPQQFKKKEGVVAASRHNFFYSRWRPRWLPFPILGHISKTIGHRVMKLVSLGRFLGSRNPFMPLDSILDDCFLRNPRWPPRSVPGISAISCFGPYLTNYMTQSNEISVFGWALRVNESIYTNSLNLGSLQTMKSKMAAKMAAFRGCCFLFWAISHKLYDIEQ